MESLAATTGAKAVKPPGGGWDVAKVHCHPQKLVEIGNPITWTEEDEETGDVLFETEKHKGHAYRLHRLTQEKVIITFEGEIQEPDAPGQEDQ